MWSRKHAMQLYRWKSWKIYVYISWIRLGLTEGRIFMKPKVAIFRIRPKCQMKGVPEIKPWFVTYYATTIGHPWNYNPGIPTCFIPSRPPWLLFVNIPTPRAGAQHKALFIHLAPKEEISAVRRGRGEKFLFDNSECIRTFEGVGGGVNFQFPPWGRYGCFLEWPITISIHLQLQTSLFFNPGTGEILVLFQTGKY